MHGGKVGVFSSGEGFGTTIFVDLPAYKNLDPFANIESLDHYYPSLSVSEKSSFRRSVVSNTKIMPDIEIRGEFLGNNLFVSYSPSLSIDTKDSNRSSFFPPKKEYIEIEISKTNSFFNEKEAIAPTNMYKSILNSQNQEGLLKSDSECNENKVLLQTMNSQIESKPLRFSSSLSFLVVDDSATNRKMTEKILSRFGHRVHSAGDGLDFLSKINCDKNVAAELKTYDVVLMDDNMPKLFGPEACKIARDRGYKGLIFGVTGNTRPEDTKKFITHGANHVFSKPLDLDKLIYQTGLNLGTGIVPGEHRSDENDGK